MLDTILILSNNEITDSSNVVAWFCFPMIVGILAFALPLLLGAVDKISSKYKSIELAEIFRVRGQYDNFFVALYLSLTICMVYVVTLFLKQNNFLTISNWRISYGLAIGVLFFYALYLLLNRHKRNHRNKKRLCIDIGILFFVFVVLYVVIVKIVTLSRIDVSSILAWEEMILFFFVIVLTVLSLHIYKEIYNFYNPNMLFTQILRYNYKSLNNENQQKKQFYFMAISKLTQYVIKSNDKNLLNEILDFYNQTFLEYRKERKKQEITYPCYFYSTITDVCEELYKTEKIEISYFEETAKLLDLLILIPNEEDTFISKETYFTLWRAMRQALFYNRDKVIMAYWKSAYWYFYVHLRNPYERGCENGLRVENKEEIEFRKKQKEVFLQFHYFLGTMLLYKEKYDLLSKIFSYTTSNHYPSFVLFPTNMSNLIERYVGISQEHKEGYFNFSYYLSFYLYPDLSSYDAMVEVPIWLKRYFAILFLRQYIIGDINMPKKIPTNKDEKQLWINELTELKQYINDYLNDNKTLKQVGLHDLTTPDYFTKTKQPDPDTLINALIQQLQKTP